MRRIYTYNLSENFIDKLAGHIDEVYIKPNADLSRIAIVFGGKRPSLFLKRQLAKKIKTHFFSPVFFSIDEFIEYTVQKKYSLKRVPDLELCYLIFLKAREMRLEVLKGRETFAQFLPWAREILSFIEQIDLQDIAVESLRSIELNAEIGYGIPQDVNVLLENIIALRQCCHQALNDSDSVSRGFLYLKASRLISDIEFPEFDQILFCGFFSLHRSERWIIQNLYGRNLATLFFQGDEKDWDVLKKLSKELSQSISSGDPASPQGFNCNANTANAQEPHALSLGPNTNLHLYSGFDTHSQVALVREILKKVKNPEQTVIVLPDPENLIPLLSQISSVVTDFNVSLGYPLKRSSFYSLFHFIFKAQLSRKDKLYYSKDYLKTLRHPFVKNLELSSNGLVTRVLIHKIEEILNGQEKTAVSGSVFIRLEDLENLQDLYELTSGVLKKMGVRITYDQLKALIRELHLLLFGDWEKVDCFLRLGQLLEKFLDVFVQKSSLEYYPPNLKMVSKILEMKEDFKIASFNQEIFSMEEIVRIFENHLEKEVVAFSGAPLKGLQILGLFETRSLNFEEVIILDANEGVLPRLRVYEPLIPREVMISLNLDRLEQEEEIQRYQLTRLISSAKQVHLIYEESRDKERSRFIEQLIWKEQRAVNSLATDEPLKAGFEVKISMKKTIIEKGPEIIAFLKDFRFSSTSVNTYLRCPLRFYYRYVLGLSEREELLDEPENREIGIFIHNFLEEIYRPFIGSKPVFDERFRSRFFRRLEEKFVSEFAKTLKSDSLLIKKVLDVRMERFWEREAQSKGWRDVSRVITVEESFYDQMALSCGDTKFVYKVDRIDRLINGTFLIVDYKTGSNDPMPKAITNLESSDFNRVFMKNAVKSFQMPLYFYYFNKQNPDQNLNAIFYNLRTLETDVFFDDKLVLDRSGMINVFIRALDHLLGELFNPDVSFKPDDSDPRYCASCPFFYVCR